MKKAILFFALVFGVAFAANAQCSSKSASTGTAAASCCSKGKASTSMTSADATQQNIGADIEQRTNAAGEVSYVRKVVDAGTGAVSYKAVEYCTKTNQFIDADQAATDTKEKAHCAEGSEAKAGCCSGGAKTDAASSKGKGAKTKA